MQTGHRYRLLIYFAALVLCLSVCFAYAEEPTATIASSTSYTTSVVAQGEQPIHLLFSTTPGRSSFMPALNANLIAETVDPVQQVAADALLHSLDQQNSKSRNPFHGIFSSRHKLKLVKAHAQEHLSAAAATSLQMTPADSEEQATR